MSAPEEIHIKPNRDYTSIWGRPIITDPFDDDPATAGYIRADLHDAAIASARAEGVREGMLKAAEIANQHRDPTGTEYGEGWDASASSIAKEVRAAAEAQP